MNHPDESSPRRPGWYPSRYGVDGWESYWDGTEWTGDSRPRRSLPSLRPLLRWIGIGVIIGAAALAVIAVGWGQVIWLFGLVGSVAVLLGLLGWFISGIGVIPWLRSPPGFLNRRIRHPWAVLVGTLSAVATLFLGIVYLIDL